MNLYGRFRRNLRAAVDADGRTLEDIAHKAGYSVSHVSHVLHGRRNNPTLQFVESISAAMGYGPLDLLKEIKQ